MDLFTYLLGKKGQNTGRDLFSYLLGKNAGGSGTYTTFSGTSLNISDSLRARIKNFMLNSTELTQDGTPSPDNPVPINVIKGENNVKVENKNLFNEDEVTFISGALNDNGEPTGSTSSKYTENFYEVTPNSSYVWSGTLMTSSSSIRVYFYTAEKEWIRRTSLVSTVPYIFTTPNNCKYIRLQVINAITLKTNDVMLEKGNAATEYVEHQEQNYPISLGTLEYCKIGTYSDRIFKNTTDSEFYDSTLELNEWYLKKNIGKIDNYNGETITTPYKSTTGGLDTGATIYYGLSTPTYIHISQEEYPTLKSQLDNIQKAVSYKDQTNITQTNEDLPFNISVDVKVTEEVQNG